MKTLKTTIGAAAVALACALPQASFGALVSLPVNSTATISASTATVSGTLLATYDTGAISGNGFWTADLVSQVYQVGSTLTFVYTLTETPILANVRNFSVNGFNGSYPISVANLSGGTATLLIQDAVSSLLGGTIAFDFAAAGGATTIVQAVVATSGTAYGQTTATVSDGYTANVLALAVPEPTTMVAGAMLLLPFGASTLRMLRRKNTV